MEGEQWDSKNTYNVTLKRVSFLGQCSAFLTMAEATDSEAPVNSIPFLSGTPNFSSDL
jgi:hypothetical protein